MTNEWGPDDIFEVWADERARQVLLAADREARSVDELAEECEGSQSSIYRRVLVLREFGLLEERVAIDEEGHHYNTYACSFDHLRVQVAESGVAVELVPREDEVAL